MQQRTYPYIAWRLTRTFQVLQVELVAGGIYGSGYDRTHSGHNYPVSELYPSKDDAIAEGERRLQALEAEIARRQANLDRRRRELLEQRQGGGAGS